MGDETGEATQRARGSSRRFWVLLGLVLVVSLGVRIVFVETVARHDHKFYDAAYYELQADANADGHWFRDPFPFISDPGPAADHPPLTALVLTPVAMIVRSGNQIIMRYTMAVLGVGVVLLIGLLGREVVGDRVGLVAAGLAAVYPYLWVNDGLIMSETLAAGLTVGAVLLACRLRRRPGLVLAVALGIVCGLATLARAELVLLAPFLALPLLISLRDRALRQRMVLVAASLGLAVVVVAPWIVWNATRFSEPVFISTNEGVALLGSNCRPAYYGSSTGLTALRCLPEHAPKGDQSAQSKVYRSEALDYIGNHLARFPMVLVARAGRTWSLFRPLDMLKWNEPEGRPRWITGLGLGFYYPLLLLAVGGAVVMVRRRKMLWPLVAPAVIVTLGIFPAYGQTRFRVPAEPSLVVLAAVAFVAGYDAVARRSRPVEPVAVPADPVAS